MALITLSAWTQDPHLADLKLNLRFFSFVVNRCPGRTTSSQPYSLLKGMKPPLKGFVAIFRAAASPSSESSREHLPACWPEPPQAGWSCSGAADEAAVSPQAVGHDQQSPRHRLATALWASTSSNMNEEIHCPRLEEKTAAQGSPSNPPSSTAPRGAESRPGLKTQSIWSTVYETRKSFIFHSQDPCRHMCTFWEKKQEQKNETPFHFKFLFGEDCGFRFFMVAFCLMGSCSQTKRESRKRFSVCKCHVRVSLYNLSPHAHLILRQTLPTISKEEI